MRKSLMLSLALPLMLASQAMPSALELRGAPLDGGPKPKPTPKRGKPTKAEKKAAKRARTAGVSAVAPVRLVEGPPRDFGQAQDRYGEHMDRPAPGVGGNDGR